MELPTVEQLAEAIAATISQRINTPPELQHAQWLTDTMTAAGVEMYHHHTEPILLRVGDSNLSSAATAMPGAHADDEEELELNYEENDSAMEVDTTKGASHASVTRGSDNEWETYDDAAHPSSTSHQ
eukprot:jgi/Tetstr1/434999/TSEL_002598.t1